MLSNLDKYVELDGKNIKKEFDYYELFNTDPLTCPGDFDSSWFGVMDKISYIGRTKYPEILRECFRLLKADHRSSPSLHTMTCYIQPNLKSLIFRLEAGNIVRPLIKIQPNGKIRIPKCLMRIWARSPTSRIPWYRHPESTIKYDEHGFLYDQKHKKNKIIPSQLVTPKHDISLPTHIWFKQLLQFQTIEYVSVLQAQVEPIGTSTKQVNSRYTHQTRFPLLYADENNNLPCANPQYKYNYCEIHQALTLSPTSSIVQFVQNGATNRLMLACKKNKQAEAQGFFSCGVLGGLHDATKPTVYAMYLQRGVIPEFQRNWFRRCPTAAIVRTAMHTKDGFDQDDAIVLVHNGGVNKSIRRKPYHTTVPYLDSWEKAKDRVESLQTSAVESAPRVRKNNDKRDISRQIARQKDWSIEELNKIQHEGLHFIFDAKHNNVPICITKDLLNKYTNGKNTNSYMKNQNAIIQKELQTDIFLNPQYSMAPVGKKILKNHSVMTTMVLKSSDIVNAEIQTVFNRAAGYNSSNYTKSSHKLLQDDMERIFIKKILKKEIKRVEIAEDEDGTLMTC